MEEDQFKYTLEDYFKKSECREWKFTTDFASDRIMLYMQFREGKHHVRSEIKGTSFNELLHKAMKRIDKITDW